MSIKGNTMLKILMAIFLLAVPGMISLYAQDGGRTYATRLWYNKPAVNWNEALPLGNGRLGVMIYGGVSSGLIELNEATLWSGEPSNWNTPVTKKYLPRIRKAALSGQYKLADSLSRLTQGPYTQSYMPMADLRIDYARMTDSSDYVRELDLDSAISKVRFSNGGHRFTRTAFVSHPDQAVVMDIAGDAAGLMNFTLNLSSKLYHRVRVIEPGHIILSGKCPRQVEPLYRKVLEWQAVQYDPFDGMKFEVHLRVKNRGGSMKTVGNSIVVEHADGATIYISAATTFNGFDKSPSTQGKDAAAEALRYLNAAAAKSFEELLSAHVADYQPFFRRMRLNLGASPNAALPTDERLKKMKEATDNEMVALVAQYGRYLLISGSRPGGQPVNLKGIWNNRVRPEYSSNWALDHDAQMWYYPVETNNLSEMHEPFLELIGELAVNGTKTAKVNYGMKGWCAHHNTDIWRLTGSVGNYGEGNPHWASWNLSNAWLSSHLYDHYLFTGDVEFLRKKAWPVMKGAAEFLLDWLVKTKTGIYVSVPSVSPENTFITEKGDTAQISVNSTCDIALAKELFTNCIEAGKILKVPRPFLDVLRGRLSHLAVYPIGSKGQLLEWSKDWKAVDPAHRHLSHLYPVFPGSEISPFLTPELSAAASLALSMREPTNSTWGFSWKAACWARLGKGDSAWSELSRQIRYVDPQSTSSQDNYGLYPNLFSSEAPYTIMNGNGCATAVITEMIVQSHTGIIDLLPAMPKIFPEGKVEGLRARGGFELSISWKKNVLEEARVVSKLGKPCKIKSEKPVSVYENDKQLRLQPVKNIYSFNTKKNAVYVIK